MENHDTRAFLAWKGDVGVAPSLVRRPSILADDQSPGLCNCRSGLHLLGGYQPTMEAGDTGAQ
jgi:hypothetical protein